MHKDLDPASSIAALQTVYSIAGREDNENTLLEASEPRSAVTTAPIYHVSIQIAVLSAM